MIKETFSVWQYVLDFVRKYTIYILFILIFTVYFSSSMGLYNSIDTPQFFTTEAILKYQNIDLSLFARDPHFFITPDYFIHNNQILGLRGYLFSILVIPIHIFSSVIYPFFSSVDFPSQIKSISFLYELCITSFFTLFSVFGLLFLYLLIKDITKNNLIATTLTLVYGFGSFIWKYSSTYARHGILVFFTGLSMYCMWRLLSKGFSYRYLIPLFLCWSLSFGIDFIFFGSMTIFLVAIFSVLLIGKNKKKLPFKKIGYSLLIGLFVICVNALLNFFCYGTFLFAQQNQSPDYVPYASKYGNLVYFSTPLFPTFFSILINIGQLPTSVFAGIDAIDPHIGLAMSAQYARIYNFYGLLTISPFLFFTFAYLFLRYEKHKVIVLLNLLFFFIGIVVTTKFLCFWGGTQYDIRYFYHYILLLSIPIALVLQHMEQLKNAQIKNIGRVIFILLSIFSILMGWLSVINMYAPALTAERRIWIDLQTLATQFTQHSFHEYIQATFMNRNNAWIAFVFSIVISYIVYQAKKITGIKK